VPSKKLLLASAVLIFLITFPLIDSVGASSEMWSQTYGGASYETAQSVVETSDGGYALAGYSDNDGYGFYSDFWLVKTDANGIPEFPSWTIMPLLLIATLAAIFYKRRLFGKSANI
jgi:hypothetical protein